MISCRPIYCNIRLVAYLVLSAVLFSNLTASSVGQDVAAVFQRAKEGAPLRYVALGGSITQSGKGWIGPWLQQQFPQSDVSVINSGMSATGSSLGIFRVERDVIAHQPDLVVLEYCVNDSGSSDTDTIRNMESLVVRLKSLPYPPAIIILEAASRGGVNLSRHRKVAQHYGLLEIDTQAAVDAELEATGGEWNLFFGDAVHPNQLGNAFYAKLMAERLVSFLNMEIDYVEPALPKPLSQLPLILDGRMVSLSGYSEVDGWKTEHSLPSWWNRFFNGVLVGSQPRASLELPFRGTQVGVYYAMDKSFGTFYGSVDGQAAKHVLTNTRGGFSFQIFAKDLEACEHRLTIVLPPESDPATKMNGPVKLGYLLLAGETAASR